MDASTVKNIWKSQIIDSKTNGWCYTPLNLVTNRLNITGYPAENIHYIVGDVMETLKIFVPEKIAILRLDTDWYESSKIELEMMYQNVVPGGVIIFDDYFHWDGQRRAVDDFFNKINNLVSSKPNDNLVSSKPNDNIIKLDDKTGAMIKRF